MLGVGSRRAIGNSESTELLGELGTGNDTRHKTLVITEQRETNNGGEGDGNVELLAPKAGGCCPHLEAVSLASRGMCAKGWDGPGQGEKEIRLESGVREEALYVSLLLPGRKNHPYGSGWPRRKTLDMTSAVLTPEAGRADHRGTPWAQYGG